MEALISYTLLTGAPQWSWHLDQGIIVSFLLTRCKKILNFGYGNKMQVIFYVIGYTRDALNLKHTWDGRTHSAVWWCRGRHSMHEYGTVWAKGPVCCSVCVYCGSVLVDKKASVRVTPWGGYMPFEIPWDVTNPTHSWKQLSAVLSTVGGIHFIKGN